MAKKPKSSKDGSFGMSNSSWDKLEEEYDRRWDKHHTGNKADPISKTERLRQYKNKERIKYEKMYEFSKPKKSAGQGTGKVTKVRNAKAGGRAQPKGTPPRTGPGSGAGGQSARYSRLTGGGLMKHGR